MTMRTRVLAVAALVFSVVGSASAQVVPAGRVLMGGIPVVCEGYPTVFSPLIPDTAMFNGQAILVNTTVASASPAVVQVFFYGHECGHAHVGASEPRADQWAILMGKHQGIFRREDIDIVGNFMSPIGDATHPPAADRVLMMKAAFDLDRFVSLAEARRYGRDGEMAESNASGVAGIKVSYETGTKWRYEYFRLDNDALVKSRKFGSEEACKESQERKNKLDDYVAMECEEVSE